MAYPPQYYNGYDLGDLEAPAPIQKVQTNQTQLPEWLSSLIRQSSSNLGNLNRAGQGFATTAANAYQTDFGQAPQLQVTGQYDVPTALDAFAQSQLSRGTQDLQSQAAAQRQAIAQQFRGQPGLSNVLQAQTARQMALNQNPMLSQIAQDQSARNLQEYQANLQGTELANRAMLGMSQDQLQRALLGNQALTNQLGLRLMPGQLEQGALSNLTGLTQIFGKQMSTGQEQLLPGALAAYNQLREAGAWDPRNWARDTIQH